MTTATSIPLLDLEPNMGTLKDDVLVGLAQDQKELPSKYFYDERGSHLFDDICQLDEYYPTRTELAIMDNHVQQMAACLGPQCLVVEYGSGSGHKTEVLLESLEDPVAYVPVEISRQHLLDSAERLQERYPQIEVLPVCADYTADYDLPQPQRQPQRRAAYFPGSTIGNFLPEQAMGFLEHVAETVETGGGLLIGADLVKDRRVLEAAYDDREGVTAEFNKNLLRRINRELGADFDLDEFGHRAVWNEHDGRIEMHLESLREQAVTVDDQTFEFERGETICTEYSHKYTLEGFANMASLAGFEVEKVWTDDEDLFSVQYLTAA